MNSLYIKGEIMLRLGFSGCINNKTSCVTACSDRDPSTHIAFDRLK